MLVFVLVFFVAFFYYIYFRHTRKSLYELSEKLPDLGNIPVIGHTHWFIGGPESILRNVDTLAKMVDESGGIGKLWIGPALYVVSLIPEDVQKILETCLAKDTSYRFLRAWLGDGLFVAPVDLWKTHRRFLLPIFSNRIIEDYIDVFAEQAEVLVERLDKQCGKEFDVYPFITSCMLDIVFETAMGERMDVQHNPDTPYLRARHTVMSIINLRLFKAWLQPDALFNLTSYAKLQKDSIDMTHKFTDEVVNKKRLMFEKTGVAYEGRKKDLLGLMLEKKNQFTNEQLREHIDSITIAGNDTTSLVICYALQLLGCHQDHQENVYQELQKIFGDSKRVPTKCDLNKMEYLERVIKEAMRLFMVVPIIGRQTDKELKLSTCTIPKGVGLAIVPYVMHRSKKIWGPDVDQFNPDRFLPENNAKRHPCSFIPFSWGTRNCIGRHFGMLAMKMILSTMLRHYKITSDPHTCDRLKIEILLFPVRGHVLNVEKRTEIST